MIKLFYKKYESEEQKEKVLIKLLSLNLARLMLNLDTESCHVISEGSGGKKVA